MLYYNIIDVFIYGKASIADRYREAETGLGVCRIHPVWQKHRRKGVSMIRRRPILRLLLLGAAPRLATSAFIVGALWIGFFWATAS